MPCTLLPLVATGGISVLLTTSSDFLSRFFLLVEHLDFLPSVSTRAGASYYFPDNYIHLQNSETMAWKGHSAAGEKEGVKIDSSKGHVQVQ